MHVAVIIPVRNEAAAIGRVLAEIPRQPIHRIIVVDNGSTDGTAAAASAAGADVVAEPMPGYGRACWAGVQALDALTDVVAFLDGDHSDYPEELPTLLTPIADGRADLVIGSRMAHAEGGSMTLQQRIGGSLACGLIHWVWGVRFTDLGPFRAIRREALEALRMHDRACGWTVEMQAKAAKQRLRCLEVPVRYRPRIGRSKISGTLGGTLRASRDIVLTMCKVALT